MLSQETVTRYTCQKQFRAMREVYSSPDYWRCRTCNDTTHCNDYKPLGLIQSFLFTMRQFYDNNISISSLPKDLDEERERQDLEQKSKHETLPWRGYDY